MLCIIDMQNDFVDQQTGKMAVKDANTLIEGIIEKIDNGIIPQQAEQDNL